MSDPWALSASEAMARLHGGEITCQALTRSLLDRIAAEEPRLRAWAFLDPESALAEARRLDRLAPGPPLRGLPIGVKDIFDTADMPTEWGTPALRGRRPAADAACVAALRRAGALVLGKTATTELAFYRPGPTRNPHDPDRTPGGSSSGSAAAVAAFMVPAALGSQTAGSTIRPASFCGVVGMKPTHGLVPLQGTSPFAPSLDTVGVFVRDPADLRLLLPPLGVPLGPAPPSPPRLGLCRSPQWALAEPATRALVERAAARLAAAGAEVAEVDLPAECDGLFEAQRTVMAFEAARAMRDLRARHEALLSPVLLDLLRAGEATPPANCAEALALGARCRPALAAIFRRVDALLTPAALGEAPPGLESTGDPAFNRIWTLLHLPCLSLPAGRGPAGMPVGIQLVGPHRGDGALVACAEWAHRRLERIP
ncbi:MAG TPA: amidase [Anaeromyxobacteraceae bacterium]|nr:amidase [Anaeromyxobacteraceae bacterium]